MAWPTIHNSRSISGTRRAGSSPVDGSITWSRPVAPVVTGEESAALSAVDRSQYVGTGQFIGRLPQAASLSLAFEPLDEIGDIFLVGCALIRSPYDEALEIAWERWAVAAPVDEINTNQRFLAIGVGARSLPVLLSIFMAVEGPSLLPFPCCAPMVDVVPYGLLPACFDVGTLDTETLLVPVVVEFQSLLDLHDVDNAVARVRWPEADYVIALLSSATYTRLAARERTKPVERIGGESGVDRHNVRV